MTSDHSIALFSAYYPSHGGGIEIVCDALVRGLQRLGFGVKWAALADGIADPIRVPLVGTDLVYRLTGLPLPLLSPSSLLAIWRCVGSTAVTVIADANFLTSVVAFMVAKLRHRPIMIIQHVGAPSTSSILGRIVSQIAQRFATRPMLRRADKLVYVSPAVANHFSDIRSRGETLIIGHGIHTDHFRPIPDPALRSSERAKFGIPPQAKVACFVGRLTVSKGISVIKHIAKLRPDWHFAVAGAGPIDASKWGLSNVSLLGHLDIGELAHLYQVSDLLVLPSQSESFSLVIREALASGCRVLGAKQILETDSNLSSFLTTRSVDLADMAATATAFADALDTATTFGSCSDAREYVVEHCSWQAIVSSYSVLIKDLTQTYPRSNVISGS